MSPPPTYPLRTGLSKDQSNQGMIWSTRVGWWISDVCAYQVILKHLYIETALQKDFSQKSIFAREITFEKWPKKWEIVIFS